MVASAVMRARSSFLRLTLAISRSPSPFLISLLSAAVDIERSEAKLWLGPSLPAMLPSSRGLRAERQQNGQRHRQRKTYIPPTTRVCGQAPGAGRAATHKPYQSDDKGHGTRQHRTRANGHVLLHFPVRPAALPCSSQSRTAAQAQSYRDQPRSPESRPCPRQRCRPEPRLTSRRSRLRRATLGGSNAIVTRSSCRCCR